MTNKAKMSDRTDPFDWSGGHPALDLVNTLDERPFESPIENLASYADLVRFAELARLIEPVHGRASEEARAGLHARASPSGHARCASICTMCWLRRTQAERRRRSRLDAITAAIQAAHTRPVYSIPASSPAHASHRWSAPSRSQYSRCMPVRSPIERLLLDVDRRSNPKMRRVRLRCVLPSTPAKVDRRQWCSMKNCGNREKQRRWRSGGK